MLAAEIWHWWIAIVLFAVSVLTVGKLIADYLRNVSAARYPNKRQRDDS